MLEDDKNVEAVVNRFKFNLDEFKEELVNIIKNKLKVEFRFKS